jgi:hypothetical protein
MLNVLVLSVNMLNAIMLNVIKLSVVILSVVMLSVVMLSALMMSVFMLNVVQLNVVMLNVVAPSNLLLCTSIKYRRKKKLLNPQTSLHHFLFPSASAGFFEPSILGLWVEGSTTVLPGPTVCGQG